MAMDAGFNMLIQNLIIIVYGRIGVYYRNKIFGIYFRTRECETLELFEGKL